MDEICTAAERFGILDHVPMGICVIRRDYHVLFWNNCLEDWTGISKAEIMDTPISRHFLRFAEARYRSRLDAIFEGGAPAVFSSQLHGELLPSRTPGRPVRVQHTIVTAVPSLRNQEHYAMFAVSDVTELTQRIQDYRIVRNQALMEVESRKRAEAENVALITELQDALANVQTLRGMLPICSSCHKVRDDRGYWSQIESYISAHSEATFSHGICPNCLKALYPDFAKDDAE